MHLGDRVLGSASRPVAVGARLEVDLEDRLEHQLEGGLDDAIRDRRDPEPTALAAALGNRLLPNRPRPVAARPKLLAQPGQEALDAQHLLDVVGRLAVHARRARPSIGPDPKPRHQQRGRVADEVVEVAEPPLPIVASPLVQLALDPEYPLLRRHRLGPRRAGIHRRLFSPSRRALQARCLPSPCGRLSRPRTTTEAPPPPGGIGRRWTLPAPRGEAATGRVPTFTAVRSMGVAPSFSPAGLPRRSRSPSSRTPDSTAISAVPGRVTRLISGSHAPLVRPISVGFEPGSLA